MTDFEQGVWIFLDGAIPGLCIGIALVLMGVNIWASALFGSAAGMAVSAIVRAIRGKD